MSLCKHLRSGGRKPMREPGNRGITGQQPLGINRNFHYLVLKGLKSALKYCSGAFGVDKRLCFVFKTTEVVFTEACDWQEIAGKKNRTEKCFKKLFHFCGHYYSPPSCWHLCWIDLKTIKTNLISRHYSSYITLHITIIISHTDALCNLQPPTVTNSRQYARTRAVLTNITRGALLVAIQGLD